MFTYLKGFFFKKKTQTHDEIILMRLEIEILKKEIERFKKMEELVTHLANNVALMSMAGMESETKFNNLAETVAYLVLSSEMHSTVEKMLFKNGNDINW